MISRWIRTWYSALLGPFLYVIARLGITANMLTVVSLFVVVSAGSLFAFNETFLGAWILLFGGFLDGIDGELSRITGVRSPFGAFLDSICDHCGDFAVYLGLLFLYLPSNAPIETMLIFISAFASVFGSHVRSRAGMLQIDTKTIGVFTRCERIFILVIGLLIGKVIIALWALAIFNTFSALQRVVYSIRIANRNEALPVYKTL